MTPARAAYSCLLWALTPAYLLKLWWRGRIEPGYRHAMAARLGFGLGDLKPGAVWIHAVSLGETLAAAPLIDALRRAKPGIRLLLTHGTATGWGAGQRLLREGDVQAWLPFDTVGATRRFLAAARPAVGVLMETEIWPNLLAEAQRVGVPTVLANGRLNERSARQARRFAALLRPAAQALSLALAQTEADAARILAAGVNEVVLAGNLKFDMSPSAAMQAQGREWRERLGRPVVALMNSREGEEALLLAAWRAVYPPQHREGEPASGEELRPLLLIVPRHPQRFTSVSELAAAEGFRTASRTAWGEVLPDSARAAEVWVGDSLGEMAAYYSLADVALLGGSFLPLGGHNLIESAANGCPLILGPSTFNFAEAAERALKAGAALRAADMRSGLDLARHMLGDPAALATIRGAAFAFSAAHQGAATRMAKLILEWADRGAEKSDSR